MADLGQPRESQRPGWGRLARFVARRLGAIRRLLARRGEVEVFPWLEHATAAGALAGGSLALGLAFRFGFAPNLVILASLVGVAAGSLLAIATAVTWAGACPTPAPIEDGPSSEPADLWDPWVDRHHEPAPDVELAPAAPERPMPVRPRVRSPETGESVPLEDELGPVLANHERGAIRLSGPPGSGKSTALEYLADRVPAHFDVTCLDDARSASVDQAAAQGRVIFTESGQAKSTVLADFHLAPWGRDEWIEYLLASARDRCGSVIARLAKCESEAELLDGLPELWQVVLDTMSRHEWIKGPREALRVELHRRIALPEHRAVIAGDCLERLTTSTAPSDPAQRSSWPHELDDDLFRLVRHRAVQLLLAADRLNDDLARDAPVEVLRRTLPRDLVREAALRIVHRPAAIEHLQRLLANRSAQLRHPMAASLLHALRHGWRPIGPGPSLKGAYLEEVDWAEIHLSLTNLSRADLSRANLSRARLDGAWFTGARLTGANLYKSILVSSCFDNADLNSAQLGGSKARDASFVSAGLVDADLVFADLHHAHLWYANLTRARLTGANLVSARLQNATLTGADFRDAELSMANLKGQNLTEVRLEGARFHGANLAGCNLEGMELSSPHFLEANLAGALMTGSKFRDACLLGADLRGAGLAEVDWEGANLRDADLREAGFHLGSSRSGLVGSPIACEGSRTGFYTDEFHEQDYKRPEEIRKANLRGADLRGAKLEGVDFYLVDLRNARLDPGQIPHLRRFGAILESRA